MGWYKTSCVCCAQNCGLEVNVEHNRIVRVRPDRDNPRSQGYVCRKGLKVAHYQHNADRLTTPLKRTDSGFASISWGQALDEIAEKLGTIVRNHGSKSFAYMGGGGQACHFEAAFGVRLLRSLGSRYHYSALAQELTGMFWVNGRAFGRQYLGTIPDEQETDMLVSVGWNGWMSHQMVQARRHLKRISDDPDKILLVIDPRKSETAEKADIHVPLRPGTDALLFKAILKLLLDRGGIAQPYVTEYVSGLEALIQSLDGFDPEAVAQVCEVDFARIQELAELFGSRKWALHADLGILMNRHSTVVSYLLVALQAVCGRIGVRGGCVIPGAIMPMGSHSDERSDKTWRTVTTGFPAIMGTFPPNVMPEEILSDHPEKLRAVLVSGANPLRSYADTTAYEQAFAALDLAVTVDVAMSETAAWSHYVLPALSAYEKWDGAFFAWTYPEIFFQMRRPVLEPEGDQREESHIFVQLADRLGLVPPIPDALYEAARGERIQFGMQLMQYAAAEPQAAKVMPFILAKTLGSQLGSYNLAALWGMLQTAPGEFKKNAARTGFEEGPFQGEQIFNALLAHPQGMWVGSVDPAANLKTLKTEDGRINLHIPELTDWIREIEPQQERDALAPQNEFPLLLMAGRHFDYNANTIMRDPAWTDGRRSCTVLIHPADGEALGLTDGSTVNVVTEAGQVQIEAQITAQTRQGHVIIPHGFGLVYNGKSWGANVNRLTKNTNRDRLAATPLHRFVRCRVEPVRGT
jgi:anaerobic selenocysteine-containing dehydrogenase